MPRTIYKKADYFNSLNRSEKARIRRFIVELGYTDARELDSHIVECRIARRFEITTTCLREVIEHYGREKLGR
ncbi:hypothetical protein [Kosakonia phage Kc304]|nr:hypothetical protein [Kosakonia phage Kc304]